LRRDSETRAGGYAQPRGFCAAVWGLMSEVGLNFVGFLLETLGEA